MTESRVHDTCREESKGRRERENPKVNPYIPKCRFIHHFNPYMKVGPFHLEIHLYWPFRAVFHEILGETEMAALIQSSVPQLSAARVKNSSVFEQSVLAQFKDIEYSEEEVFDKISADHETPKWNIMPLNDPYRFTVSDTILFRVSKRIEMATNLNVTKRYASTIYQTTNYGLAGMVERHFDPIGYEKGAMIPEGKHRLIRTGDIIATFMAWMKDTELGGATGFTEQHFENALFPQKGSAAFWINLTSCHSKDLRSVHSACPVLKGSKWTLNKWIFSYDQWQHIPCDLIPNLTIKYFSELYK